jgi:hypothetical protein
MYFNCNVKNLIAIRFSLLVSSLRAEESSTNQTTA